MDITNDIKYVGIDDKKIRFFEGQFPVSDGMKYNSYLIMDEKITIMDSVDFEFAQEWINKIKSALKDKTPYYLVVQHMEPDHSGSIVELIKEFPNIIIISSSKSFDMMKNYFDHDYIENRIVIEDDDIISLGKHKLRFFSAPMVHWPEVFISHDIIDNVLFSADAFGKFGTASDESNWIDEARRYYFGIVGKYGLQVANLLKKLSDLDVKIICSLHGPVLKNNIQYYIDTYNKWANYISEDDGILVAYTSVYGNTRKAVEILDKEINKYNVNYEIINLQKTDVSYAIAKAFKYKKLIIATTTYNAHLFPHMYNFIHHLIHRNFKDKIIGLIENGSWAPMSNKIIMDLFAKNKIIFLDKNVSIKSSIKEKNIIDIIGLVDELIKL
ncbi:MAG: FprA family A-type flavoprotein [Erysipelotrichaceae bacterium]|nr:FprA family A-type flavoprotein [Erysipelotrichaceae bacterium]